MSNNGKIEPSETDLLSALQQIMEWPVGRPGPDWYTTYELAEKLGTGTSTMYKQLGDMMRGPEPLVERRKCRREEDGLPVWFYRLRVPSSQ